MSELEALAFLQDLCEPNTLVNVVEGLPDDTRWSIAVGQAKSAREKKMKIGLPRKNVARSRKEQENDPNARNVNENGKKERVVRDEKTLDAARAFAKQRLTELNVRSSQLNVDKRQIRQAKLLVLQFQKEKEGNK